MTDLLLRQEQASRAGAQGDDDYDVIGCRRNCREFVIFECANRKINSRAQTESGGIKHELATIA